MADQQPYYFAHSFNISAAEVMLYVYYATILALLVKVFVTIWLNNYASLIQLKNVKAEYLWPWIFRPYLQIEIYPCSMLWAKSCKIQSYRTKYHLTPWTGFLLSKFVPKIYVLISIIFKLIDYKKCIGVYNV